MMPAIRGQEPTRPLAWRSPIRVFGLVLTAGVLGSGLAIALLGGRWQRIEAAAYAGHQRPWWVLGGRAARGARPARLGGEGDPRHAEPARAPGGDCHLGRHGMAQGGAGPTARAGEPSTRSG